MNKIFLKIISANFPPNANCTKLNIFNLIKRTPQNIFWSSFYHICQEDTHFSVPKSKQIYKIFILYQQVGDELASKIMQNLSICKAKSPMVQPTELFNNPKTGKSSQSEAL